jgi:inhibitor of cysteine peptidase
VVTVVVHDSDQGQSLHVGVGDTVLVELQENLSTGSSWQLVAQPSFLELIDSAHQPAAWRGGTGAPGVRRFRFLVTGPGDGGLDAVLLRPWDPENVWGQFSVVLSTGDG